MKKLITISQAMCCIAVILVMALILGCKPPTGPGTLVFESGTGKPDVTRDGSDLTIRNPDELAQLAVLVNGGTSFSGKTITLEANLDLSKYGVGEEFNSGAGWKPIGGTGSNPFKGEFDGKGKTIRGLSISAAGTNDQGLFGYIDTGSTVKDLKLTGVSVTGKDNIGSVAAINDGTIENCSTAGAVTGNDNVGGVTGNNRSTGRVENCSASASATGNDYVGGAAGVNWGTIENCTSSGAVTGKDNIGGVAGNNVGTLDTCKSSGSVTGSGNDIGGVAGSSGGGAISGCYNTGAVTGTTNIGGVVGKNSYNTLSGCHASGSVSGATSVGGVVGWNEGGTVKACYYAGGTTGTVSATGSNAGGVAGLNDGTVTQCYATGTVTATGTDSEAVGGIVGSNSKYVYECYATATVTAAGASAKNVGGIAGYNTGTGEVADCYATGNITTGDQQVGGIAGTNVGGEVLRCYATGKVEGVGAIGGIAGVNTGTVALCVALNSSIVTKGFLPGRVVDTNSGTLTNNYGRAGMDGTWTDKGLGNNKDGEDVTSSSPYGGYNSDGFWPTLSFDFYSSKPIWVWSRSDATLGSLPKLAWE